MAGDDAVAGDDLLRHAEVEASMGDEFVDFLEAAWIEQQLDAFARGELAGVVLPAPTILAAAQFGTALQIGQCVVGIHRRR